MQTLILKLWQGKDIFQDLEILQDMEGLVLNSVEIPVEIQDMEIFLDM